MGFKPNDHASEFIKFRIGEVRKDNGVVIKYWTNIALDHVNGRLTNERLYSMNDEQLRKIGYSADGNVVYTETYRRPDNTVIANKQGGEPSEEYEAAHRAVVILNYREEKANADKSVKVESPEEESKAAFVMAQWRQMRRELGL